MQSFYLGGDLAASETHDALQEDVLNSSQESGTAGQVTWTRDLARDLFPGVALPFAWSILRVPAEFALRRALVELGAPEPAASALWHRADDGRVFVSALALAEAGRALCGAAWLGTRRPEAPAGIWARLQVRGMVRRVRARIDRVAAQSAAQHGRVSDWLARVRGLAWTQADLLQVMEELEPRARDVLQSYFMLVAGLSAARSQVDDWLVAWLPDASPDVKLNLFAGLEGLPTIDAARQLTAVAAAHQGDPVREVVLSRYGHRGPGEVRPDARRWADDPALLIHLAEQPVRHAFDAAEGRRDAAEAWVRGRLEERRHRQFVEALERARFLCRTTDLAWDALTMVVTAAQLWLRAASVEALAAGLISQPADALYMELEELKQVATGEWHCGHSEAVQAAVMRRRHDRPADELPATECLSVPGSPGYARGPAYIGLGAVLPGPAAIWVAEGADPGCAPFWLGAGAVVTTAVDVWSPGMIAARGLGVPAVGGGVTSLAQVYPGQTILADGAAGRVVLI